MFGNSTGLYFYSATLQADAALLSVFAIFVIFRMQQYEAEMSQIGSLLVSELRNVSFYPNPGGTFLAASIEQKRKLASELSGPYATWAEQWIRAYDKNSAVRAQLKVPTWSFAGLMILSLCGIVLADWLHSCSQYREGFAMIGIAALNTAAIVHLGRRVISITEN